MAARLERNHRTLTVLFLALKADTLNRHRKFPEISSRDVRQLIPDHSGDSGVEQDGDGQQLESVTVEKIHGLQLLWILIRTFPQSSTESNQALIDRTSPFQ